MNDTLNITGVVATTPRHVVTTEGLAIASFRLASAQRRYNRATNTWSDGDTNWYTVTAFRQLAINIAASIHRGERVVLSGRLRLKPWQNGDKNGLNVEIDADSVGHDLNWGTSAFARVQHASSPDALAAQTNNHGGQGESPPATATESDAWATLPDQATSIQAGDGERFDQGVDNQRTVRDPRRSQQQGVHTETVTGPSTELPEAAVPF
ncbi:single-stranded DNA-binding protein [Lysinibacter cavernae]|uniref:Single-strand DNA-binding protein n=1 Tax=Lysinibacter cavernae TaxID=1640652 RepID=A0A7X5TT88_9MICO|nr:single-stranded DNA-binding protein [Lysinibacter cavernae]NIH53048.1 single-strand DNA-binding protein [Lysinibacter cavernae]